MSFNQAAINTLIANIKSGAQNLGLFQQVLQHEPKSAPQHAQTLAFWVVDIKPSKVYSDLTATAGVVTFHNRIYVNALSKPEDQVEGNLLTAVSTLIGEYSSEFSFGGTVINVDLLGAEGTPLSMTTGYVTIDSKIFRMANIVTPVIIDHLWTQGA